MSWPGIEPWPPRWEVSTLEKSLLNNLLIVFRTSTYEPATDLYSAGSRRTEETYMGKIVVYKHPVIHHAEMLESVRQRQMLCYYLADLFGTWVEVDGVVIPLGKKVPSGL